MLSQLDPGIDIIGTSESITQTIRLLQGGTDPDLIFMDIQLSDGNSFAIFDRIEVNTPIIFTTAFDQFAIKAFKVNSIDYLLKPIKESDLKRALEKFSKLSIQGREVYVKLLKQLPRKATSSPRQRLILSFREDIIPVDTGDISFIYTSDRNTAVFLKNGKNLPCNTTLEQIMGQLDSEQFIRANKQFILAKDSIMKVSVRFDSRLYVTMDTECPETIYVSKNKAAEFKSWMSK